MRSCSSAHNRSGRHYAPVLAAVRQLGVGGPGQDHGAGDAGLLLGKPGRPKRNVSASFSQLRNLGHARVQLVQPRRPWLQPPGPSSSSRWKGR